MYPPYGVKSTVDIRKAKNIYFNIFSLIFFLKKNQLLEYASIFMPPSITLPKSISDTPTIPSSIGKIEEIQGKSDLRISKLKMKNCGLDINLMLFR